MPKIKLDNNLYHRAAQAAQTGGYPSIEEFVTHLIEKELERQNADADNTDQTVQDRLRGLGYIE